MFGKLPFVLTLFMLASSAVYADFSRSTVALHPQYPGTGPFIIEIKGTWPTDCHPGEQLPVIRSFDGHTVAIKYEIVVVHVTCNDTDTSYISLVDMSGTLEDSEPLGNTLTVKVEYQDETFEQTLDLVCGPPAGCPNAPGDPIGLERGLYVTPGRHSEGLLVARQNELTVIYPLVYDELGRPEWLFSVGRLENASFFADLYRWEGGDCFDCDPGGDSAEMTRTGQLSVLVDRPGTLQVKVNDRPFFEYQRLVYGYDVFRFDQAGAPPFTDLEGRWALSENHGTFPLGDLTEFLPGAFDISLEGIGLENGGTPETGQISYLVTTVTGEFLGQLVCKGQTFEGVETNLCEFIDETDQAEPLFWFFQDGPSSLSIEFGRPVLSVGIPPGGKAVRLD